MDIDEARRILAAGGCEDIEQELEAVSVWLRFNGISEPRLLHVAELVDAARAPEKDAS